MSDLPFEPSPADLRERLAACLDREGKIPRALDALGPVHDRDVLLIDGAGGMRARQLADLGARVTVSARQDDEANGSAWPVVRGAPSDLDVPAGSTDVVIACWSAFRGGSLAEVAEADRVLRPGGRLLVVHDYGRDDTARLRGDLPEYGSWGRRTGWFLTNGFKVRVLHCFWTFASMDEMGAFLDEAFGDTGRTVAASLNRPRLSYKVAVYHRTTGHAGPIVAGESPI